jgi:hypothetical protein
VCPLCHVGVYTLPKRLYCGHDTGLRYVIHFSLQLPVFLVVSDLYHTNQKVTDICFYHQNEHSSSTTRKVKRSPYNRPRRAHRGSRGIALLIVDLGARRGGWSAPRPGRFTPGKYPVPIVQEAGWAPGPVWTCAKNLAPTGIWSPDRPARSQSLYRLSYPAHFYNTCQP